MKDSVEFDTSMIVSQSHDHHITARPCCTIPSSHLKLLQLVVLLLYILNKRSGPWAAVEDVGQQLAASVMEGPAGREGIACVW